MNVKQAETTRARCDHEPGVNGGVGSDPESNRADRTKRMAWGLLLLPLSLGAACSSASDSGGGAEDLNVTWSEASGAPAVRILVEAADGVQETWIPAVGAHVPSTDPPGMRIARLQAREQVVVGNHPAVIEAGFMFLAAAAAECGAFPGNTAPHGLNMAPLVEPWGADGWFIFPHAPESCDEALLYSVGLTCMADKLEALAEAVKPTRWNQVANLDEATFPAWNLVGSPWIIPPMAPESRVVVRDLARYALSQVSLLENYKVNGSSQTCAERYGQIASSPSALTNSESQDVFGGQIGASAVYPPLRPSSGNMQSPITLADAPELARHRLLVAGNNLRAASRLLEGSIRASVTEDSAEAEHRRAMTDDLTRSSEAAWGLGTDGSVVGRFGTYGHAVKVLRGRLEMGASSSSMKDPACGGVSSSDLVSLVSSGASKLRPGFAKVVTPGQQAAVCMVERLGLVVPGAESAPIADLRVSIKEQAMYHAAAGAGVDPQDSSAMTAFLAGPRAQSVGEQVDAMADGNLRLALTITGQEYGLLLDEPLAASQTAQCGSNGLPCSQHVAPSVTQARGVVLHNGIPKGDLTTNAAARAGAVGAASACAEAGVTSAIEALDAGSNSRLAHSDPFALAHSFGKRLVVLREIANEIADDDLMSVARSGAAEVGAWAGRTQIVVTTVPRTNGRSARFVDVTLAGLVPEDVGALTERGLEDQFVVVYGTSADADCAAGVRSSCSDAMLSRRRTAPLSVTRRSLASDPALRKRLGADGVVLDFRFRVEDISALGSITYPSLGVPRRTSHFLYVIQKHAPEEGMGAGKVIGAFSVRGPNEILASAVSPIRDRMLDRVVGISKDWVVDGCRAGSLSPAESKQHCAGAPRSMMVPLENELMDGVSGDELERSYRYFLSRAKDAANRADDLGRQLIEQGIRADLRREAAQEELAALCGSYAAADQIEFNDYGNIKSPEEGTPLRTCIDEQKHPIVFLSRVPDALKTDPAWLRLVLQCDAQGQSNPMCATNAAFKDTASLDLADWMDPEAVAVPSCAEASTGVESLATGFRGKQLADFLAQSWFTADALRLMARLARLEVDYDGQWRVFSGGIPIMSSSASDGLFPGCLREQATECRVQTTEQTLDFSRAFREPGAVGAVHDEPNPCWLSSSMAIRRPDQKWQCIRPLGGGDQPPGHGSAADREAEMILWRVQGAIWMLGSMGGEIPERMFSVPVLAADFANTSAWNDPLYPRAPLHTVYGMSRFVPVSGTQHFQLDPYLILRSEERNALAEVGSVPVGSGAFAWPDSPEIPLWVRVPYQHNLAHPGAYLQGVATSWTEPSASMAYVPRSELIDEIGAWVRQLDKMVCASVFAGSPSNSAQYGSLQTPLYKINGEQCSISDPGVLLTALNRGLGEGYACGFDGTTFSGYSALGGSCPEETRQPGCRAAPGVKTSCGATAFGYNASGTLNSVTGIAPSCGSTSGAGMPADAWRPSERIAMAVNSYPGNGMCGSTARFASAVTLACAMGRSASLPWHDTPPEVASVADIAQLESWIFGQSVKARQMLSRLYLEHIPKRVVEDIRSGTVASGSKDGRHGILVAEMSPALLNVVNGWVAVEREIAALGAAVRLARIQLRISEVDANEAAARLAIEQLQLTSAMMHNAVNHMSSLANVATGDVGALLSYPATVGDTFLLAQQKALIDDLQGLQALKGDLTIAKVLLELSMGTEERFSNLQLAFNQIMSATAQVHALAHEIRMTERQARWAAAKATGADFVMVDGEAVAIPVNAVYNRDYDLTKRRYQEALADAKYLAYVARLAIEQRIGRRLQTLDTALGPVEPPSRWADDVCRLTGVDYEAMREVDIRHFAEDFPWIVGASTTGGSSGGSTSPVQVDPVMLDVLLRDVSPFVGDYVAKLENFIDYYNLSYPFHEGDDTVVLSLRDHVLGPREACTYPAPNLLPYSHALDQGSAPGEPANGWVRSACDETKAKCVDVLPGSVLGSPDGVVPATLAPVPPASTGETGATWLRDLLPGEASPPEVPTDSQVAVDGAIEGVSQTVRLDRAGAYLISWWDQARSRLDVGAFPSAAEPPVAYRVEVRGPSNTLVASIAELPHLPNVEGTPAAESWSERRILGFTADQPGDYTVTFLPSHVEQELGSVVIANVQLEAVSSSGAEPGPYAGNGASATVMGKCRSLPAEEFRASFERSCAPSGECFYELSEPLTIDAELLSTQNDYLGGIFARGNYNFRHITVALNVAGTGVIDCTANPQASCYATGTLRYSLEHDAFRTDIIAGFWQGELEKQSFNFGSGAVRRGQALAAERYITMPVSNADAAMLAQSGLTKVELMGRPIGGSYRLKLWDSPELVWDRVEDIQVVLKYRYWSAVAAGR